MKHITFLALIFCAVTKITAQTYHPLPTQNAYWTVYEWDENMLVYDDKIYTVDGDTLLNNIQYTKVYKLNDHPTIFDTIRTLHCFMRQDNVAKKIWFIRHYLGETNEKLGYDLSLNLGDTVCLPAHAYEWDQDSIFILYIADTNSVPLNNGQYRNFYSFSSLNNSGRSIGFVEGIAAFDNTFPDRVLFWDAFHQSYNMCMHENNTYMWPANGWPVDTTYCGFNLVSTKKYENDVYNIYPNPANNYLNVDIPSNSTKVTCELIDLVGNKINKTNFQFNSNPIHFDLSSYPSGVYIFVIRTLTTTHYNKLIINH